MTAKVHHPTPEASLGMKCPRIYAEWLVLLIFPCVAVFADASAPEFLAELHERRIEARVARHLFCVASRQEGYVEQEECEAFHHAKGARWCPRLKSTGWLAHAQPAIPQSG